MRTPSSNNLGAVAFLFPGQGSQAVGMGKELAELYPVAKRVFEEADDVLGYKLSQICFQGPEDQLRLTEITQPAILTASVAAWRVLNEKGVKPDFVAGHSLGEYSAHVAAGTISFADAARTVRNRGKYMQEAVPVGVGAMAAIVGMDLDKVTALCRDASQGQVCEQGMRLLITKGVQAFVEVGPGRVLCGLMRQIERSKTCLTVGDEPSLQKTLEQLAKVKA